MTPGKIDKANLLLTGNGTTIADLHAKHEPPFIHSEWIPTPAERKAIAEGGNVILTLMANAHPPVSLTTTDLRCDVCGVLNDRGTCEICTSILNAATTPNA